MAKFLNRAGLVIETDDAIKIECYKAQGLQELIYEPQPTQEIEIEDDFIVKPAKKKKKAKGV